MNQLISIIWIFLCAFGMNAQGIEFFHGSWNEALKVADEEGKIIFVDAYTTWCGPCKRMAKNVFPLKEVGDFFNENFISLKLDMERGAGLEFRKKYPVSAYPTFYWIGPDGEVVQRTKGARQPQDFITLGKEAVKKYDGSAKYKKSYDEGARDYETVYKYVETLNKAGKPSLKISNDYLKSQSDLTTEENLNFILEAAVQADSRIFSLLEEYKSEVTKVAGKEAVDSRIKKACSTTAQRAVTYESPELLEEAITAYRAHFPRNSEVFEHRVRMDFAVAAGDAESYRNTAKTYLKKVAKDNPELLLQFSNEVMSHFRTDDGLMDLAEKSLQDVIKMKPSASVYYSYASLLFARGQKEEALKKINKGIQLAESNKESTKALDKLKSKIEQS